MPAVISCTTVDPAHFSPIFCQSLAEAPEAPLSRPLSAGSRTAAVKRAGKQPAPRERHAAPASKAGGSGPLRQQACDTTSLVALGGVRSGLLIGVGLLLDGFVFGNGNHGGNSVPPALIGQITPTHHGEEPKIFIEYPELRKYFYDRAPLTLPRDDPEYQRAIAVAVFFDDAFAYTESQAKAIPQLLTTSYKRYKRYIQSTDVWGKYRDDHPWINTQKLSDVQYAEVLKSLSERQQSRGTVHSAFMVRRHFVESLFLQVATGEDKVANNQSTCVLHSHVCALLSRDL